MDAKFKVICNHVVGSPLQQFTLVTCPRCLGKGFYNSYSFGTDGKMLVVSGVNKLSQQIQKILTEAKRPSGYGFDYSVLTGVITPSTVTAVKSEILRCIEYLKASQQQEKKEGFMYLPTEEISTTAQSITVLDASVNELDPRSLLINLSVLTVAGTTTDVTTQLRR